jgi:anti-sigma28 factor (negative regulator of flagellin synthesis)
MNINRINPLDPLASIKKADNVDRAVRTQRSQSIQVSSDAQLAGERFAALEAVKRSPDVRQEEIERVRATMLSPTYLEDRIEKVADRIMEAFSF